VSDASRQIVQRGYDAIVDTYADWARAVEGDPRERFLDVFEGCLPHAGRVLDLGCGNGLPSTERLARRFDVVGVDISEGQLALARENVPAATFVEGDFTHLSFPDGSVEGVVALYSISHVPRDEHAALFARISGWLAPGGFLLTTLGAGGTPDWTGEWLGVEMFFSSFDAETNLRLLEAAGLTIVTDEVVSVREPEPEGVATFLWVLAWKPP
jgi:SAM-dependent methyltransferase